MTIVFVSDATRSYAHNLDDLRERWKIRKEEPTEAEWMPVVVFRKDISGKSRDDLLAIKTELLEQLIALKLKTNKRLPKAIYHEMNNAIRSVGVHVQVVDSILATKTRKKGDRALSEYFVDIARERLSNDIFWEFINDAQQRMDDTLKVGNP